MNWNPLTPAFCAESTRDGIDFAHTYHAPDVKTAVKIAERNGWRFLGELIETVEITDSEVAMFERDVMGHTIQ